MPGDDVITGGEFGRFRADFNARMGEVSDRMGEFSDRMDARFDPIDQKFADLDGRTRTQAEAIVALDTRVATIASRGCGKYEEHQQVIALLAENGGLSRKKQIGIAAGSGAGFIGVIEVVKLAMQHFWK